MREHSRHSSAVLGFFLLAALVVITSFQASCLYSALPFGRLVAVASNAQARGSNTVLLPNYSMTQFHLPTGSLQPWGLAIGGKGIVWFVEEGSNQVGSFNPQTKQFKEYNVTTPKSLLEEISVDSSGLVWFSELNSEQLGELDPSTGVMKEFKIPQGANNLPCGPIGVTAQSPNAIWLTCEFSNQIDRFFPSNESFQSFDLPVFYSSPLQVVFDSRGNFWFTAADADMIGYGNIPEMHPGTSDGIREVAPKNPTYLNTITNAGLPTSNTTEGSETIVSSLKTPSQLAISPDGKTLWITEHTASSFDSYDLQNGSLTKYWTSQTHDPNYVTSLPNGIAVDENGIVWIAEHYGNKIAEFDPRSLQMVEYPIPCCANDQIAGSLYLALGQNHTVWFTEFYGNAIGELAPSSGPEPVSISLPGAALNESGFGGNRSLPVGLQSNLKNETFALTFDVSGISPSGAPENATASFYPDSLELHPLENGSTTLGIYTDGLDPGTYYLTVSARVNATGVACSKMLELVVTSRENPPVVISQSLLLEGVVFAVIASVGVVAFIGLFTLSRRRKRSRPRVRRIGKKSKARPIFWKRNQKVGFFCDP